MYIFVPFEKAWVAPAVQIRGISYLFYHPPEICNPIQSNQPKILYLYHFTKNNNNILLLHKMVSKWCKEIPKQNKHHQICDSFFISLCMCAQVCLLISCFTLGPVHFEEQWSFRGHCQMSRPQKNGAGIGLDRYRQILRIFGIGSVLKKWYRCIPTCSHERGGHRNIWWS